MNELTYSEKSQFHYNDEYIFFTKSFLSQWYGAFKNQESSFVTFFNGEDYKSKEDKNIVMAKVNCAEQAMMLHKASLFKDKETFDKILKATHPKDQKALGREVKNFDQILWDNNRLSIVTRVNIEKFSQNSSLKRKLISTENRILVEAAPWDKVWGIGMGVDDPDILDEKKWKGLNLLGLSLMLTRDYLRLIEEE